MSEPDIVGLRNRFRGEIAKVIVDNREAIDLLLAAMFTGGHVLLEGPPGTAKTLLARAFAAAMSLQFGRIQFTPDLMPGDVLGVNMFNFGTSSFDFVAGPIFTEILLADEINRTPPKTQAALLEAMNERTVTIDGQNRPLSEGFMVIATQNPIEQQGTYPLPEAQLDRFLFKHIIAYPSETAEQEIVKLGAVGDQSTRDLLASITPVADISVLSEIRNEIGKVTVSDEIVAYAVALVRATRVNPSLQVGVSPRAAMMMTSAARAMACLEGRDYVIPDDVKQLSVPVMRHRVSLMPGAEIDGLSVEQVVGRIIDAVEPPR